MINNKRLGLTLGTLVGGLHAVWSLLVAFGYAKPFMDWVMSLHFVVNPGYQIQPFDLTTAVILVVVTSCVGYAVGYAFATIWNKLHR